MSDDQPPRISDPLSTSDLLARELIASAQQEDVPSAAKVRAKARLEAFLLQQSTSAPPMDQSALASLSPLFLAPVPLPTNVSVAQPELKAVKVNRTVVASVMSAAFMLVGGTLGGLYLMKSGQQPANTETAPQTNNGSNNNGNNNGSNNNGANNNGVANPANNGGTPPANGTNPNPNPAAGTTTAGTTGTAQVGAHTGSESGRSGRTGRSGSNSGSTASTGSSGSTASTGSSGSSGSSPGSTASAAGGSCASRCRGDIACLLTCGSQNAARPNTGSATGSSNSGGTPPAAGGPESPSRSDVIASMRGVSAAVRACATGQPGPATVSVVFASSGRITSANVAPPFAGTPAGSCIARAVRSATVPPFSRASFQINYPFAL